MPFFDQNEAKAIELAPGVTCRPIWGERIMMGLIDIAPGAEIPDHTHPHEQCGRVLSGAFKLTIDGETRLVREGDHYVIPPGVPHSATRNRQRVARAGHMVAGTRGLPRAARIRLKG